MKKHFLFCILIIVVLLLAAVFASFGSSKPSNNGNDVSLAASTAVPEGGGITTPAITPIPTPSREPEVESTTAPVTTESPMETPLETPVETPESTPVVTEEPIYVATPEPTPAATPTPVSTPVPFTGYAEIDLTSPAILGETADMGQEYLDKIIFLGDSTTYGLKAYGVLSGGKNTTQVWTPTSGTLTLSYQSIAAIWYPDEDTEITIREAVQRKQPEMMVITLGVNGVSFMNEEDFVAEYTDLVQDIQEISPNTKIIIQSIFPIAGSYEYKGSINNEKICRANTWLLNIAENTGVRYLNTISVLMGSDGYMPESYQNGDGLHLNGDSFRIVLNYIRTHGYE